MNRHVHSHRTAALLLIAGGLGVVGIFYGLRALGVGKIGDPSDIGGGAILLLGYILTLGGLVWVVTGLILTARGKNTHPKRTP